MWRIFFIYSRTYFNICYFSLSDVETKINFNITERVVILISSFIGLDISYLWFVKIALAGRVSS